MSGGSMNYLYQKVDEAADELLTHQTLPNPLRAAFAAHLRLVAAALHDIEWVDSGDLGPENERASIRACLQGKKKP